MPAPAGPHPVIIVDIDTLRADHLGCYGHDRDTSPNIDRFAAESVRFEWAFSQAPNTPPSQASILTGLYPSSHGLIGDDDRLAESVTTLAEVLSGLGYTTAAFVDGGYMKADFGLDQGFDLYHDNRGRGVAGMGKKVLSWLRDHAGTPFLLLIHTYDVHTPYDPPEPYRSMFVDGLEPPTPGFEPTVEQMERVRKSHYGGEPEVLPANDVAWAAARYDGGIRYVDTWFGELMTEIAALGLDRTATIVVLSDHGEEFQEHGSVLHEKLYATVTRVPLIVRLPGGGPPRTVSTVVGALDVTPTLIELAGGVPPAAVQGRSLVPLLRGQSHVGPEMAFGESPFFGVRRHATLDGYRLLSTRSDGTAELYRFREDPLEQRDIAAEEPERVARMRRILDRWEEMVGRQTPETTTGVDPLDDETRRHLRALGYLN